MKTFSRTLLLSALALLPLTACTETRVIRDGSLDAKFRSAMPSADIKRGGQQQPMPGFRPNTGSFAPGDPFQR